MNRKPHIYTGPGITMDEYRRWEYRRFLDNETPGKHGFYTADEVAA